MTQQKIYVACLAAYNAGTLHGAWIDVTDEDTMSQEIELMLAASPEVGAEECAIHDFEAPFPISEHDSLSAIIDMATAYEDHGDAFLAALELSSDVASAVEMVEDQFIGAYERWADMAYVYVHEGLFGRVEENLAHYLDYDRLGRDLRFDHHYEEINGRLYVFSLC